MLELFFTGIVGLCVGSALANCAWHWGRLGSGPDEVAGQPATALARRSLCEACGTRLGFVDLLPVAGWFVRRGRCAHCGVAIPAFYWLVELLSGLMAVLSVAMLGLPNGMIAAIVGCVLLLLALIDIKQMMLPDVMTLPLLAIGLLASWTPFWPGPYPGEALAGALAGIGLLYAVRSSYAWLRGRCGLGLGDVKLFAAAGAWCGWAGLPNILVLASMSVLLAALITALRQGTRLDGTVALPFGPSLAFAFWLQLLWSWPLR